MAHLETYELSWLENIFREARKGLHISLKKRDSVNVDRYAKILDDLSYLLPTSNRLRKEYTNKENT